MKEKSPQEKKELSYAKDCRNTYGENDKGSRKSIPKRKAEVNRVYRRDISNVLKAVVGPIDLDAADVAEHVVRSVNRGEWKKCPDTPLGEFVERKIENRMNHAGKGKSASKAVREFIEKLKIISEQVGDKWIARVQDYPSMIVNADSEDQAVEKLQHILTVAKRNELGSDMRVLIDGKFVSPTLSK